MIGIGHRRVVLGVVGETVALVEAVLSRERLARGGPVAPHIPVARGNRALSRIVGVRREVVPGDIGLRWRVLVDLRGDPGQRPIRIVGIARRIGRRGCGGTGSWR